MPSDGGEPQRTVHPEDLEGDLVGPGSPFFRIIWINPERLGGTPCFYATRVPVKNLFDYLKAGRPVDVFLDDFPGVTPEQVDAILTMANDSLLQRALAA